MTFSEAYASIGPDVEAIAELLGIPAAEADKQINAEMNRAHAEKARKDARREYQRAWAEKRRASMRDSRLAVSA
ncbi:hypothetical protein FBZ98_1011017 [Rhizobium sp. ERR 922]|uniref:hypothetical protein n=1 Tax=unclassified Rhizobium TaxID=2613769 RepID=UPI0011AAE044|nr:MULTISPECIES: hypothetical protein [unclassified Rhizobium]TWB61672.1 hypothetical protein FBZ98_1011017 [Rhizobium sp. ERR 922]TWC04598.1 hypothetical protein FBZ97_1011017 [Rhizobium sp. ERR 942]